MQQRKALCARQGTPLGWKLGRMAVGLSLASSLAAGPALGQDLRPPSRGGSGHAAPVSCSLGSGDAVARSWLYGADLDSSGSVLFRIDPVTGNVCSMGITGISNLFDIAFLPNGRLLGVSAGQLVEIHPRTGAWAPVGSGVGYSSVNALVAESNEALLAATADGRLIRIDVATGAGALIGAYGGGLGSAGDLAISPIDGRLFGMAYDAVFCCDPAVLVEIDPSTGEATAIEPGVIGFEEVYGIAFEPFSTVEPVGPSVTAHPRLLAVAFGDVFNQPLLIEVDVDTGNATGLVPLDTFDGMGGLAANLRVPPVWGDLIVTDDNNSDCDNPEGRWTACQHQTGFHGPGPTADDLYAWDFNLNLASDPQSTNADRGRPVFAVAAGTVVNKAGTIPPGGTFGVVHVEHSPYGTDCGTTPIDCWWSGYLHLDPIEVDVNDPVDENTLLGFISDEGIDNDHLHFVVYEGQNSAGGLESVDLAFACADRPMRLIHGPVTEPTSFHASEHLVTAPGFLVTSTGDALLYAGSTVSLQEGLRVEAGGRLEVRNETVRGCPKLR